MKVTLEWYELLQAALCGVRRHIEALHKGLPDKHGFDSDGWGAHIEGAAGEMAAAKSLGLYWNGSINTFSKGGDVGALQVRTRSKSNYDLIVRHGDSDNDIFILVRGMAPSFDVVGWAYGRDCKKDEYKQSYGGRPEAWFVPASSLNHISLLLNMLR